MARPVGELLQRLGPIAEAFERNNINNPLIPRTILNGEMDSFDDYIIDLTEGVINNPILTTEDNLSFETKYLWIINPDGLFLIPENTPNASASRGVVCHSNITKGAPALQGGELWFIQAREIVINFKSGRYGAVTEIQENAVIEYFRTLEFEVIIDE